MDWIKDSVEVGELPALRADVMDINSSDEEMDETSWELLIPPEVDEAHLAEVARLSEELGYRRQASELANQLAATSLQEEGSPGSALDVQPRALFVHQED